MTGTSVRAIARDVSARVRSAEQIARETVERAVAYQKIQPEAWINRVPEDELCEKARQIDERVASGESLPLAGVPVAVKDNIDVAGLETTAACPAFAYRAESSAALIERLLAAGALVVGKTNLDQFASGLVGTRSPYGSLGCVFNREYVSGGSSSGSAVLVGAGVVPLALGSDTAGSGRVPAAFNHLVGFKPTRGRWSSRGLVPACRTLDCVTTLTKDVEDAALVDSVLASYDPQDPYSRRAPAQARVLNAAVRVGVPGASQLRDLAPEDRSRFQEALERVRGVGGMLVEVDVTPLLEAARLLYSGPWVAERTATVESLLASNPSAIHPVVRAIVQAGKGVSGVETFKGMYRLQSYMRSAEQLWDEIDVLLMPTTPTIYRRSEVLAEPVALNANLGVYTNFVNLLDMSAIALPAGFRQNGTAVGVSFIAPAWSDNVLLQLAALYMRADSIPEAPGLDLQVDPKRVQLAVVGAHLSGMPLHWQLTSREARFVRRTRTAETYRLFAMTADTPPRPALIHCGPGGSRIELEIYELEMSAFGSFVAEVRPPLAIGTVALEDGTSVCGFVAEPRATTGALDITAYGGWRAFLARR
ncbi:MAG TPA: allophanate hydrolase [Steroidobacteraceae bacterium]